MSSYGYQGGQAAKNTTSYPSYAAPAVSKSTPLSSYAGVSGALAGAVKPVTPLAPQPGSGAYAAGAGVATAATPTKTVATTPAAQPAAPAPATSSGAPLYDYTTDPILQQVQAASAQSVADAQAAALSQQKQLAIQYGDAALANSLGDSATAAAAAANPYSVYGQLAYQQPLDEQALDENLNKSNLYYSGARVNQQGALANQYGQTRAADAGQEQSALGQIQQTQLAAQLAANQSVQQAQSDAYNRYLQQLLANPGSLTGASSDQGDVVNGTLPGANTSPALVQAANLIAQLASHPALIGAASGGQSYNPAAGGLAAPTATVQIGGTQPKPRSTSSGQAARNSY